MARDFFINGACLVQVKGNLECSTINALSQLGLTSDPTRVILDWKYKDINVDAWGAGEVPADKQFMLAGARVITNLIHLDRNVLDICIQEAFAGGAGSSTAVPGQFPVAGTRMGGGNARFASGNHYIGLNLTSPIGGTPWRFFYAHIANTIDFPIGVEKSVVAVTWEIVPYTIDPWGSANDPGGGVTAAGTGSRGYRLWDHTLDT